MALIYYETGTRVSAAKGAMDDYTNVFVTQDESEARAAYQTDRRNYLARLTFDDDGSRTEFWNSGTKAWEADAPSADGKR